jgi:AAA+ ATPase superfamily predicted ATPase
MMIDRETERGELRTLMEQPKKSLALLYGRRRVGKTFLLRNTWPSENVFYYLASDTTPAFNRRELVRDAATWSDQHSVVEPEDYPTWRAVFRFLFQLRGDEPLVIVLDEFQYLLGGDDDIRSQFIAVWDLHEATRPLVIVLAGSAVRTMRELDHARAPLYGRLNWKHHLQPFDYWHAGQMTPLESARERALAYGVYGGTPRYLESIEPTESLRANVCSALLSPRGDVRHLVETVLEQERGLRNIAQYKAILSAIARGRTALSEIADLTGMPSGTPLRRKIGRLEDLGFVEARQNFAAGKTAAYRYHLSDPALRFYHAIVERLRNELETSDPTSIWDELVEPRLQSHMGRVFEEMVRQAYFRLRDRRRLPAVSEWNQWEGQDRNRQSLEMDIVARLSDGRIMTGAIKWNERPISAAVHHRHLRDLQRLADSGYGWAHEALEDEAILLYAAAGGFDETFEPATAASGQRTLCWNLEDMYSDDAAGSLNLG